MEADFINVFVQKQKDTMVDLLLQRVMLEARLAYAETKLQSSEEQIQQLKITESKYNEAVEEIKLMKQENANLRRLRTET